MSGVTFQGGGNVRIGGALKGCPGHGKCCPFLQNFLGSKPTGIARESNGFDSFTRGVELQETLE